MRAGREAGGDPGRALVVEAHPVDQRAVVDQPEQPRRRVAGLRLTGDGADLDVVEAEHRQAVDAEAVLVESGRETERAGQVEAERGGAQRAVARGEHQAHQLTQTGDGGRQPDPEEGQVVGLLRVHLPEDEVEQGLVQGVLLLAWKWGAPGLRCPPLRWCYLRPALISSACSWSDMTPTSSRSSASMPWTAAPIAWTVVRHGTARATAAVRIS